MDPASQPREKQLTREDVAFEEAFDKMFVDSYQERMRETVKASKDIPVPIMAKTGKKTYEQIQSVDAEQESVPFVLMLRGAKGGKQQFKTFAASTDSALAVNLRVQEQKIREENEKVKRLTLNITERIEEEDYQESLLQKSPAPNRQNLQKTPKQQKYKHQKGAPDADKIFG